MIILKHPDEVEKLYRANQIVAHLLEMLREHVVPGVTTLELDRMAEEFIRKANAKPAFKGYRGYPATLCTSINEVVVHGIPSKQRVRDGDLVSIDVGVILDGYFGDAARTFGVGHVSEAGQRLIDVTREALVKGIEKATVAHRLFDISAAIQGFVEGHSFSVVRAFVGHGIGRNLHEEPQVPNFGQPNQGPRLKAGMVLAIEPMVNLGGWQVEILEDHWTTVTIDRSLSSHFEHSVAILNGETRILSQVA
ncbi:MAG: type I methionyl aminopeptidase [bacterium]|nr:type I methionyl aminopeptidase [bacterium]